MEVGAFRLNARLAIVFVLSLTILTYSQPSSMSKDNRSRYKAQNIPGENLEFNYGPKLPDGEDGQANIDAAQKLWMLYIVGGIALGVVALIVIIKQAEDADMSWN